MNLIDEQISVAKLHRLGGILTLRLYRRAKRMDYCFTPYWKLLVHKVMRRPKIFEIAKLLDHQEEEEEA